MVRGLISDRSLIFFLLPYLFLSWRCSDTTHARHAWMNVIITFTPSVDGDLAAHTAVRSWQSPGDLQSIFISSGLCELNFRKHALAFAAHHQSCMHFQPAHSHPAVLVRAHYVLRYSLAGPHATAYNKPAWWQDIEFATNSPTCTLKTFRSEICSNARMWICLTSSCMMRDAQEIFPV